MGLEFKKVCGRYRQFGGKKVIRAYGRMGVLGTLCSSFFKCLFKGRSLKGIYPSLAAKVEPILRSEFEPVLKSSKERIIGNDAVGHRSNIVWFCWMQGIDNAPQIVRACLGSLRRYMPDRDIRVIDADNFSEHVALPEDIVAKWKSGVIPHALFSDLIRLELVVEHGGTWIDSTVLCSSPDWPREYLDSDLFLFRYSLPGQHPIAVSNWFITSCTDNPVIVATRDMLFEYWRRYDCVVDYYMMHLFISMAAEEFPELRDAMPYGNSSSSLALLRHLGDLYEESHWQSFSRKVCFHKLSFRLDDNVINNPDNYCNALIREFA